MTRDELTSYMEQIRDFRLRAPGSGRQRLAQQGFIYANMEDLLLQHGRWFDTPAASASWRGIPKSCFHNARVAAKKFGWTYCEGLTQSIIPIHHAWCIDTEGKTQEVTWEKPGSLYFGIPFPGLKIDLRRGSSWSSLLDNWEDGYSLYKKPFKVAA